MNFILEPIDKCFLLNKTDNLFENIKVHKKLNRSFNIFLIFAVLFAFASIKVYKRKLIIIKSVPKKTLMSVTISTLLLPVILAILLIFATYRKFIGFLLQAKLKSNFKGFMLGGDVVWALEDVSKSIIHVLLVVEYNADFQSFYANVKETIEQNFFKDPNRFPKLLSTFHKSYGYHYFIENSVTLDDCVKTLPTNSENDEIEKDELMKLISARSNESLPKNHTALWEMLVGTQHVNWKNGIQKYYPIIFRVHHSLADGASLLKILLGVFDDKSTSFPKMAEHHNESITNTYQQENLIARTITSFLKQLANYWNALYLYLLIPTTIKVTKDDNILHGHSLSGKKMFSLIVEDTSNLLNVIKRIKEVSFGATFSNVLLAAVSRSFRRYFEKKSRKQIPNYISAIVPAIPAISEVVNLLNDDSQRFNLDTINLSNKFSVAMFDIPINFESTSYSVDLLNKVKTNADVLKNSVEFQANFWLINFVSALLPEPFLRPLINSTQSTLIISNLPGPSKIAIFNGCLLEDIAFWVPHRGTTGIGLSILSYDNRMQIGLNVDEVLICNDYDAQSIVEDICNQLNLMYHEIGGV